MQEGPLTIRTGMDHTRNLQFNTAAAHLLDLLHGPNWWMVRASRTPVAIARRFLNTLS